MEKRKKKQSVIPCGERRNRGAGFRSCRVEIINNRAASTFGQNQRGENKETERVYVGQSTIEESWIFCVTRGEKEKEVKLAYR